jgi:hypothetical protein
MLLFNLSLILKTVNEENRKAPEELRMAEKRNCIKISVKVNFERVTEESHQKHQDG